MKLQELLKSLNLTEEQITAIVDGMKENKIYTASEENLDIRYGKLKEAHDSLAAEHGESVKLIEQMKKDSAVSGKLSEQISTYESTVQQLQQKLANSQLESAIKIALLSANTTDVDYMTFRLKEKGDLKLDESGNIEGIDDKIAGLKTQFPAFFGGKQNMEIKPQPINQQNAESGMTKAEFLKKSYAERAQFAQENPEAFRTLLQ